MAGDERLLPMQRQGAGLVDVLDRILDKGLVIAGDVKIALADVELLTIRIRLIVCSVDKAEKIGMDWWRADPYFSSLARNTALLERVATKELAARELAARDLALKVQAEGSSGLAAKVQEIDDKLTALLKVLPGSEAAKTKEADKKKQ